jgi:hypothetical protein
MSKIAEAFQEYGLTGMSEVVGTFIATGKGKQGERLIVEITIIRSYGSTETKVEQPFCNVVRIGTLAPYQTGAPTYSRDDVKDWRTISVGYQHADAESALRNALLNLEINHLDTPRAREVLAQVEKAHRPH